MTLDRRTFLKVAGGAIGAAALSQVAPLLEGCALAQSTGPVLYSLQNIGSMPPVVLATGSGQKVGLAYRAAWGQIERPDGVFDWSLGDAALGDAEANGVPTHHHRRPTPTPSVRPSPTPSPKGTPSGKIAAVSGTVTIANVTRIGLNLDQQEAYDQRAYMQNYLDNPGFEFGQEGHLIIVKTPTSTTFVDNNDLYAPEGKGFWNGQTATIRTGSCAGQVIKIGTYTAGGAYTYSPSCAGLAINDLIGEHRSDVAIGNHTDIGGWNPGGAGLTIFNLSTAQHHSGVSSLVVDVSSGSGFLPLDFYVSGTTQVGTCISPNQGKLCQTTGNCPGSTACQLGPQIPSIRSRGQ